MSGLYVLAGIAHWVFPKIYLSILPAWVPWKRFAVWASGLLEIALGAALLLPASRELALYGIMGMLVAFLPVHTHMITNPRAGKGIPNWVLWLRIPLQGLLIAWAWAYLE